jgi:hypothetical protein
MSRLRAAIAAVLFTAAPPAAAPAQVIAQDNAGNAAYADGWQAGDNGGTGFGAWTFAFSGDPAALVHPAPQFIDTPPPLLGNSLGSPAFALTTSARPTLTDTSSARRNLVTPLTTGLTFHLDVDGSALDPTAPLFTIGNTIQLFGTDGTERWGMFTNNGFVGNNWASTGDVNTGVPAANAFHLALTVTGVNTFNLVLTPVGGGAPLFTQNGTLTGTAGTAINSLLVTDYGTGSSADGSREIFFNNIRVTAVPEPGSAALVALAAVCALGLGRRSIRCRPRAA